MMFFFDMSNSLTAGSEVAQVRNAGWRLWQSWQGLQPGDWTSYGERSCGGHRQASRSWAAS